MTALLKAALAWAEQGCSVVPTRPDGSKAPIGQWKRFMSERATPEQLAVWLAGGQYDGFGVVCGAISGNIELLEFEGRALHHVAAITELADSSGLGPVWQRLMDGYRELTPTQGLHIMYRVADGPALGNTKLARGADGLVWIETRGEGGYVIVSPSGGRTHPSGGAWSVLTGGPDTVPTLTVDERDALHDLCRMLDETPVREDTWSPQRASAASSASSSGSSANGDDTRPGDDYNARADWADLLHDWAVVYRAGGVTYWRRPGKTLGISATTGRNDSDNLYVFTTSTGFEAEKPYSKFAAYTHLHHGGNYSAASRQLRSEGFGTQETTWPASASSAASAATTGAAATGATTSPGAPSPSSFSATAAGTSPEASSTPSEPEPSERTSWWPRDLAPVLTGQQAEPAPTHLYRDDDTALFYAGKVNGLIGESESGKTWVALLAALQALRRREHVVYLDFEDTAPGIVTRLRDMGATDGDLTQLTYIGPDESLHAVAQADLAETLTVPPALIVLDGFNAAMTLLGLDLNSNTDATRFAQMLLKPLARTGAAVIYVDHVPKNAEQRGKGGIGAQAKRAMTTGCALTVDVAKPFGRGQAGSLKLNVDKDRPGHVRAIALYAKYAGIAHLEPVGDTGVNIVIRAAEAREDSDDRAAFRPTNLMQKVSSYLAGCPDGASGAEITKNVRGDDKAKAEAVRQLTAEGYVGPGSVARGGHPKHVLLRPYFESSDPLVDPFDVAR